MQSIDHLIDAVANYVSEQSTEQGIFYFSKINLNQAYRQIPLDPQLQNHCNFNVLGGKTTGKQGFLNGIYGLTDMPAKFQKTIITLKNCRNKVAFLDDILVIKKGSVADQEKELDMILYQLDKENLAIKLRNPKNTKTTQIIHGMHSSPNKIHTKTSGTFRTTKTTIIEKQNKSTK